MLITREQREENERITLAPYAQKVAESAGRAHPEPDHPFRTAYQRDRARVIHSRAFRRLEYKTQVFLNGTGDHLRTRLTHTIEVASVSRSIAGALGLNEELAEVVALAHDLGHSPFGHVGEKRLNELMKDHGGFEHNLQSLRVVEILESVYPKFSGLNLSYEILEGLRKHDHGFTRPAHGAKPEEHFSSPCLEAQITNRADEITYYSHDLDDGLNHQLIHEEQLIEIEIWKRCLHFVKLHFPQLEGKRLRAYVIRTLIDFQVADIVNATNRNLQELNPQHADDIRRHPRLIATYSEELRQMNQQLRKFLYQNLYFHSEVCHPNARGADLIASMFQFFLDHPDKMGERTKARLADSGLERTVCDYVSGMTDRFIVEAAEKHGVQITPAVSPSAAS